ncbi:MAG: hypothetical protein ACK2TU_00110, partial [Anaerolineales bacterium]
YLESIEYDPFTVEELILLGDIKHNIPNSTIWERNDVKNFIDSIEENIIVNFITDESVYGVKNL